MTDTLDYTISQAGLSLLRNDSALVVLDGQVPNGTAPPYVLVYTYAEWPAGSPADALDGLSGAPTVRWYCHCVGATQIAAIAVAQRVRTQMLNARLSIPDLPVPASLGLIYQESAAPPTRNESTGALVMDAVAVYRLMVAT